MLALFIRSTRYGGEQGERLCIGIARRRPSRCHFDRNLLFVAIWSRRRLRSKVAAHDLSLCVDRHQVAAERLQPGMRSAARRSGPPTFFGLGIFLFTDCHPPLSAPCPPSPRLEDSVCNFSSSQGRRRCIKDKMHGKLEEGTAPNFDRAPDD